MQEQKEIDYKAIVDAMALDVNKEGADTKSYKKQNDKNIDEDNEYLAKRKDKLLNIAINNIDNNKKLSGEAKQIQIEKLKDLSLAELEARKEEKSKEQLQLENNTSRRAVNVFLNNYKGSFKDTEKLANSFEDFYSSKKFHQIVEKSVEESELFQKYKSKLAEYKHENKSTDSPLIKLLNHCANVPTNILEAGIKNEMIKREKANLIENKEYLVEKVQSVSKSKDKGVER